MLDGFGTFLVETLQETPSRVLEGPTVAVEALAGAMDGVLSGPGLRHAGGPRGRPGHARARPAPTG